MGLDMYLHARKYIKEWKHHYEGGIGHADSKGNQLKKIYDLKLDPVYIVCEAGYWRKANHIHRWFVNNVQDGNDNCREYYVDVEKLKRLVGVCQTVLSDRSLAAMLLPTQEGFFFGGTEYNEDYFSGIEQTIKICTPLLEKEAYEQYEYYYQSSW